MSTRLKAILIPLLKLSVSVLLIFLVIQKVDTSTAFEEAKRVTLAELIAAALLMVIQTLIAAFRWVLIVRAIGHRLPYMAGVELMFAGSFFAQILPSVGGDIVRGILSRRNGLSTSAAISSIVLERGVSVLGVAFLILVSFPLLNERIGERVAFWPIALVFAAIVTGGFLIIRASTMPGPWRERWIFRVAFRFAGDIRQLFLLRRELLVVFFLVVLAQANLALATFILARALSLPISFFECALLMPPVVLVASLPISIGGWGVREGVMVVAFGLVGVQAESALVLSVLLAFTSIVASLPGSLVWLRHKRQTRLVHRSCH